jgi:DNA polymerase-3 subunit epsilon
MREIVLDTETTGLDPEDGHRIVEIGAVELFNHLPTGRVYHQYINPERPMPPEAQEVHGLDDRFLSDKPPFAAVVDAFLAFVDSGRLVIHNATFDMRFINAELRRCGRPVLPGNRALDTLAIARSRFPGAPASLDALCRRFGVDNSAREKHGALLDCELLAEVYLELVGGRQPDFGLTGSSATPDDAERSDWRPRPRPAVLPCRVTQAEAEAHAALVASLGENAIWARYR